MEISEVVSQVAGCLAGYVLQSLEIPEAFQLFGWLRFFVLILFRYILLEQVSPSLPLL